MEKRSAGSKMGDWFRHILSCCDRDGEEAPRPALQIVCPPYLASSNFDVNKVSSQSGPTNFRREEIRLPGLDEEQSVLAPSFPAPPAHPLTTFFFLEQTALPPRKSHNRRPQTVCTPPTPPLLALRPLRLPHRQNRYLSPLLRGLHDTTAATTSRAPSGLQSHWPPGRV